jgi:hypothetical protein
MPLGRTVKKISLDNTNVAYRPPQDYLVATATYTIFTIADGPVMILALGCRETTAAVGATTLRLTVSGVNVDAAAVAVNGGLGWVGVSTLNVAGTFVNAAGVPLTDALLNSKGFIAGTGTGLIIATFGIGTDWIGEFFCVYRKLSPLSRIYAT